MAQLHMLVGSDETRPLPAVRKIAVADLKDALVKGIDDFSAMPTHVIFLTIIYPVIGLVLARLTFGYAVLPMLFPLAAGFALVGPFAALGLYELSRRREQGLDVSWTHAFGTLQSQSIDGIVALGVLLMIIFLLWLAAAQAIYIATFGYEPAATIPDFLEQLFTTRAGWTLIIAGNGVGFLFAVLVLTISVVSFPLLVDRDIGAAGALITSVRVVLANPITMALWGRWWPVSWYWARCRSSSDCRSCCRCSDIPLGIFTARRWSPTRIHAKKNIPVPRSDGVMRRNFRPPCSPARIGPNGRSDRRLAVR